MSFSLESFKQWCFSPKESRRAEIRVALLTLAWTGSWLLVKIGIVEDVLTSGWALGTAIVASGCLGLLTVWAYLKHLNGLDELRRKIEMDALGLAFGVGMVSGLTGSLLGDAGMLAWDEMVSYLFTVMFVTYSIGVIVGYRRYS